MAGEIAEVCCTCRWVTTGCTCSHLESIMRGTKVSPSDVCDRWEPARCFGQASGREGPAEAAGGGSEAAVSAGGASAGERRGSVLLEAERTVNGARQDCYGSPEDSFKVIAELWTTWLRNVLCRPLTAHDVAMMMSLFKHARLMHGADRDGYRDACGYLGLACDMADAKDREKE